jgi:hypothetical protein
MKSRLPPDPRPSGPARSGSLPGDADETHVVFNNCYRDYAHVNARQLAESLTPGACQGQ